MWISDNWQDYELLDASDGERLERWGKYILIRPDPQIIWKNKRTAAEWKRADGIYRRSKSGGGGVDCTQYARELDRFIRRSEFHASPDGL